MPNRTGVDIPMNFIRWSMHNWLWRAEDIWQPYGLVLGAKDATPGMSIELVVTIRDEIRINGQIEGALWTISRCKPISKRKVDIAQKWLK